MAENEVQIVIKAVDNASQTLDRIEKKLDTNNKSIAKSNQALGDSFTRVQGAMLNLGQVAQGVHNIFETYQNKTRLLENAQDRLENATLRLKQANYDLAASLKKVDDVEKKHSRDALTVERAQLRVEQATYDLNKTLHKYSENSVAARSAVLDLKEAQLDLADAQGLGKEKADELAQAQQEIKDKQDALVIANNLTERAQRGLNKALSDANWMYVDMATQALSVAGNLSILYKNIGPLIGGAGAGGFGGLTSAIGLGGFAATAGTAGAIVGLLAVMSAIGAGAGVKDMQKQIAETKSAFDLLTNSANETDRAIGRALSHQAALEKTQQILNAGPAGRGSSAPVNNRNTFNPGNFTVNPPKSVIVKDALIRPGQAPVQFSPKDTIIAAEDIGMGRTIINITGDNYGTDPDNIADAILLKLRRKISV